ncbi:MAG: DUF4139 domain-containing protein [Synergistaceae bacterium]|nr:DUF4139 domain-containing protein [Synergistaceae bacterium]
MKLFTALLALLIFAASCSALDFPEGPNVDIMKIDFYPSGAKFTFSVRAKNNEFEAIIPGAFLTESIRALEPEYLDGDIRVERRTRTRWLPSRLMPLKEQVDAQTKIINELNARKSSLEQTLTLLKDTEPEKSKPAELLTYIKDAQTLRLEAENELAVLKVKISEEQEKLRVFTNELNSRRPSNDSSFIVVSGQGGGDIEFEAFTNAASWSPKYTLDFNTEAENIAVKMFVKISQKTGLDFNGDMTLHTKNPDERITTPDVQPLRVGIKPKQETIMTGARTSLQRTNSMYKSAAMYDTMVMDEDAVEENAYEAGAAAPKAPAVRETLSDRLLDVDGLTTGDGSEQELEVIMSDLFLTCKTVLMMIPEQRNNAWIIASMDENNEHLIPGIADLRVDGQASGRIFIEEYGVGQKKIPFGYADQITIKKERLVEKTGVSWFSGVFTSGYKLEITNGTKSDKLVTVRERLPIPTDDKIKLDVKNITPKEKERDKENRLTWEVEVPAGATVPIIVDYTLSYPSGEELQYR